MAELLLNNYPISSCGSSAKEVRHFTWLLNFRAHQTVTTYFLGEERPYLSLDFSPWRHVSTHQEVSSNTYRPWEGNSKSRRRRRGEDNHTARAVFLHQKSDRELRDRCLKPGRNQPPVAARLDGGAATSWAQSAL